MKKHKFRWGEEEYTICITQDDWWIEESIPDMSERMMRAGTEFALEHGMAPSASTCIKCGGTYVDTKRDYHIGAKILHDLDQRKCWNCDHTILPPQSVERVDEVLTAKN